MDESYLLVLAVGGGDHLRQVLVVHLDNVLEEVQVWLIVVVAGVGLVQIRDERGTASSAEFGHRDRRADTHDILQVQVGLAAVCRGVLVVEAAVVLDDSEVLAIGPRSKLLLEQRQVRVPGVLLEIAGERDLIAVVRVGFVVAHGVQVLQTLRGDGAVAVSGRQSSLTESLVRSLSLAVQSVAVCMELAEAGRRSNQVNVLDEIVGNRVLQRPKSLDMLHAVDVVLEVGIQQLIGSLHISIEGHPVGILLDVGDTSTLQPLPHSVDRCSARLQHALHLIVGAEVLAVVWVIRTRHLHQGVLETSDIALGEGDLQPDGLVATRCARVVPS